MLISGFGGEPKICTFGILDKVTVVPTVGQTVGLEATGRDTPQTGILQASALRLRPAGKQFRTTSVSQ